MLTLSYGFFKPQTGDKGSVFFPDLESNFQQLNDHTHNGLNSSLLTAASSTAVTQAVSHLSWSATSGGTYKQTVTMSTVTYDAVNISFRDAATGRILHLTAIKLTSTTYDVYINDNTIDVTAVYS